MVRPGMVHFSFISFFFLVDHVNNDDDDDNEFLSFNDEYDSDLFSTHHNTCSTLFLKI
jgi:hypothetical protein